MRSLIIATEVQKKWPESQIHFILNRNAPYAKDCPFPKQLIDTTPTKDIRGVNSIMSELMPDVVIFDASGRKAHFQHAKNIGAKTVFFSQHTKKRSKGLKLNRLKLIDHHFVVQPKFIMPDLSWLQKMKLNWLNKEAPLCIGPVFSQPSKEQGQRLLSEYGLSEKQYLIFSAGSGGHKVNGELAAELFYQQAKTFSEKYDVDCVVIMGSNYPKKVPVSTERLTVLPSVDNPTFINLLAMAKATVISGGDALLQAIALKVPSLSVPVSKDQPARIDICYQHGFVMKVESKLSVKKIEKLYADAELKHELLRIADDSNGLPHVLESLKAVFR
ncbi:hypothetical protein D5018_04845 [Parashewanella curva]|uniref:Glycosyl transferase family 28 C-terminal domain-containing protein n=1 Tax=Parashewanella curva TaxID=2338552 RepID=A0A3L8PZ98_9GAMM|nr:hypothetical protein [Parashewanella curva]RLV60796.1 hypothetical protein D5018_04845 [Parashewanella curva]